jgi:hypothetical protein
VRSAIPTSTARPRTPFTSWRHWGVAGLLVFGIGILVGLSVGLLAGEQRGWIAGGLAGALTALIRISWPVRKEPWFWGITTLFAAADAVSVYDVNWSFTDSWNGHEFSGLVVLDLCLMMAIVYALYRLNYGAPANVVADEPDEPSYSERDINL